VYWLVCPLTAVLTENCAEFPLKVPTTTPSRLNSIDDAPKVVVEQLRVMMVPSTALFEVVVSTGVFGWGATVTGGLVTGAVNVIN